MYRYVLLTAQILKALQFLYFVICNSYIEGVLQLYKSEREQKLKLSRCLVSKYSLA
jgi:hypothetical protein